MGMLVRLVERVSLVIALGGCVSGASTRSALPVERPDIVFVLLDDVRYDDLIGHPFATLPHLARLVREGASFTHFYTAAPLCSPSRAVFMTGQYAFRNGIVDNGERAARSHQLVTFPRLLHDAGYRTGFFGKWHMGHEDDSPRPGFDRWVSFTGQGVYFDPRMNVDGHLIQTTGYTTDLLSLCGPSRRPRPIWCSWRTRRRTRRFIRIRSERFHRLRATPSCTRTTRCGMARPGAHRPRASLRWSGHSTRVIRAARLADSPMRS
jgi:hypothetical protein